MDEFEFFLGKEWSDGLPVVTPTEERIGLMLSGTRRESGEVIGHVAPAGGELSIQTMATHAVMAGCKPEYMPVLIAGLEALLDERFNVNLIQATTSAGAPFLLVNGPYAKEIGLHGGVGCMGPGFRANLTIGRAVRLIMMNVGGGIPGVTCLGGFGGPWRNTFCIMENEEESPWESYAESKGFLKNDNVVTMIPLEGPVQVWDDASLTPDRLLTTIADMMSALGGPNMYRQADMSVVLGAQHAHLCADAGLTRSDVHQKLLEMGGRTIGDIKRGGIWRGEKGADRWPFPVDVNDDDFFVPAVGDPDDLHLIVAGSRGSPSSMVMHGITVACRAVIKKFSV